MCLKNKWSKVIPFKCCNVFFFKIIFNNENIKLKYKIQFKVTETENKSFFLATIVSINLWHYTLRKTSQAGSRIDFQLYCYLYYLCFFLLIVCLSQRVSRQKTAVDVLPACMMMVPLSQQQVSNKSVCWLIFFPKKKKKRFLHCWFISKRGLNVFVNRTGSHILHLKVSFCSWGVPLSLWIQLFIVSWGFIYDVIIVILDWFITGSLCCKQQVSSLKDEGVLPGRKRGRESMLIAALCEV